MFVLSYWHSTMTTPGKYIHQSGTQYAIHKQNAML